MWRNINQEKFVLCSLSTALGRQSSRNFYSLPLRLTFLVGFVLLWEKEFPPQMGVETTCFIQFCEANNKPMESITPATHWSNMEFQFHLPFYEYRALFAKRATSNDFRSNFRVSSKGIRKLCSFPGFTSLFIFTKKFCGDIFHSRNRRKFLTRNFLLLLQFAMCWTLWYFSSLFYAQTRHNHFRT